MHPQSLRLFLQFRLPFPWRVGLSVKIVKIPARPQGVLAHQKLGPLGIDGQRVGGISLQLDGIGTRFLGSTDDLHGILERMAMIRRHLRNNISSVAKADRTSEYINAFHLHV